MGPRCPPPAVTVNRSWLGKQGRGRAFIAQPASLFQKREHHTPNPPMQLPILTMENQSRRLPKLAPAGISVPSSFCAALSPKSGGRGFLAAAPEGTSSLHHCQQVPCQRHAPVTRAHLPQCPSLPLLQKHLIPKRVQQVENDAGSKSHIKGRWSPEGSLEKPSRLRRLQAQAAQRDKTGRSCFKPPLF